MSDFLARLAMRAVGTLPTAHGRVPAIFEPSAVDDRSDDVTLVAANMPATRHAAPPLLENGAETRPDSQREGDSAADRDICIHNVGDPPMAHSTVAGEKATDAGLQARGREPNRSAKRGPSHPARAQAQHLATFASSDDNEQPGAAAQQTPRSVQPHRLPEPLLPPIATRRAPSQPIVSPPPTVRITIGRVEVRATTETKTAIGASVQSCTREKRLVSLDDYLKGAGGGKT